MRESYAFYTDKLKGEYLEAFKQIEFYCNVNMIDESSREERLMELLDVFITAQHQSKPVSKITGSNIQRFCREFCSDIDIKSRLKRLLEIIKFFAWMVFVSSSLGMLSLFDDVIHNRTISNYDFGISKYLIASCIMCVFSLFFDFIIYNAVMQYHKKTLTKAQRIFYGIFSFVISAAVYVTVIVLVPEFKIPVYIYFLVSGIYLAVYYIAKRKYNKGQKAPKIKIFDIGTENVDKEISKTMLKQYRNKNKRRIKRGKAPLTQEEFLQAKEKECDFTPKLLKWIYIAVIALVAATVFFVEFESWLDMIFYLGIQLTIQILIYRFFCKIDVVMTEAKRKWIEDCRRNPENLEQDLN